MSKGLKKKGVCFVLKEKVFGFSDGGFLIVFGWLGWVFCGGFFFGEGLFDCFVYGFVWFCLGFVVILTFLFISLGFLKKMHRNFILSKFPYSVLSYCSRDSLSVIVN